jgi:hypothetical protein
MDMDAGGFTDDNQKVILCRTGKIMAHGLNLLRLPELGKPVAGARAPALPRT